jgi:hypothetical protein
MRVADGSVPNDALADVFSELVDGANATGDAVALNSGDLGLLRSLARLSPAEASRSADGVPAGAGGSATIAAHAQHVRFGLSLLNRWAREGGDPFADARWEEAWKISAVDDATWSEIRAGLGEEARLWREALVSRPVESSLDLRWMIGSVAHLAYHLGAIRQILPVLRGPREGAFPTGTS